MQRMATLSTSIDADLKRALQLFCKRRGLKLQKVVEDAIREELEDERDLATYLARKDEAEVSLQTVLRKRNK
jgi:hypothetical protein